MKIGGPLDPKVPTCPEPYTTGRVFRLGFFPVDALRLEIQYLKGASVLFFDRSLRRFLRFLWRHYTTGHKRSLNFDPAIHEQGVAGESAKKASGIRDPTSGAFICQRFNDLSAEGKTLSLAND